MQEYDYTIRYRKGVQNANADALSRRNKPTSDSNHCGTLYT